MKTLIGMLVVAMLVAAPAHAINLVSDNFDYAPGASLLDNGWVKSWSGSKTAYVSDLEELHLGAGNAARFVEGTHTGMVKPIPTGTSTISAGDMVRLTGYLDPGGMENNGASLAIMTWTGDWDRQNIEIEYGAGAPGNTSGYDWFRIKGIDDTAEGNRQILIDNALGLYGKPLWARIEMGPDLGNGISSRFFYSLDDQASWNLVHEDFWAPLGGATVEGLRIFGYNASGAAYPGEVQDPAVDSVKLEYLKIVDDGGITPSETSWDVDSTGSWHYTPNWDNHLPDPSNERFTAIFGEAITEPRVVTTETDVTVRAIQFDHDVSYAVAGFGTINLVSNSEGINASINVANGTHQFQAPVKLNSLTDIDVASGSTLSFNGALDLAGSLLTKSGTGTLAINNRLTSSGGTISNLGGTIAGVGTIGGDVTNGGGTISPGLSLPPTSAVPEPAALVLLAIGSAMVLLRRN